MNNIVFKKKAEAKWKRNGFDNYRCSKCKLIIIGQYHLVCPGCKSQMHNPGDTIFNEATGEVAIIKLKEEDYRI